MASLSENRACKNGLKLQLDGWSAEELIAWINKEMQCEIVTLRELKTGAIYCQLMHRLYPKAIEFGRVKLVTRFQADFEENFTILHAALQALKVNCRIVTRELIKGRGHLEFGTWMRQFYERNNRRRAYNPIFERGGKSIGLSKNPEQRRSLFHRSASLDLEPSAWRTEAAQKRSRSSDLLDATELSINRSKSMNKSAFDNIGKKRALNSSDNDVAGMFKHLKLERGVKWNKFLDSQLAVAAADSQLAAAKVGSFPAEKTQTQLAAEKIFALPDVGSGLIAERFTAGRVRLVAKKYRKKKPMVSGCDKIDLPQGMNNINNKVNNEANNISNENNNDNNNNVKQNIAIDINNTNKDNNIVPKDNNIVPKDNVLDLTQNIATDVKKKGNNINEKINNITNVIGNDIKKDINNITKDISNIIKSNDEIKVDNNTTKTISNDINKDINNITQIIGNDIKKDINNIAIDHTKDIKIKPNDIDKDINNATNIINKAMPKDISKNISKDKCKKDKGTTKYQKNDLKKIIDKCIKKNTNDIRKNISKDIVKDMHDVVKYINKKSIKDKNISKDIQDVAKDIQDVAKDIQDVAKDVAKDNTKDLTKDISKDIKPAAGPAYDPYLFKDVDNDCQHNEFNDKIQLVFELRQENTDLHAILFNIYQLAQLKGIDVDKTRKDISQILKRADVRNYLSQ